MISSHYTNADNQNNPPFPASYDRIIERVNHIDPVAYAATRNFSSGAVTYLSPYISRGVISLNQIVDSVLQRGFNPIQIEKFLQELAWREFYQRVWQNKGEAIWGDIKQAQPDTVHDQMISSIASATTGIEAIDFAINELYQTGYMHNHLRMYTASIACNIAKAHWLTPSKWMYYHLLDGDTASNNCSWQWVAAAFSSKKYYCNQENINKFTASQQLGSFLDASYDDLMRMDIPAHLKTTSTLALHTLLPSTDIPALNKQLPTLIYNSYNLDRDWHREENVNRILLLEPSHFEKYPVSQKVLDFIIALSQNIDGIQIFTGEFSALISLYSHEAEATTNIRYKEHPSCIHYRGMKESRSWLFPDENADHSSFFSFWNKCKKNLLV